MILFSKIKLSEFFIQLYQYTLPRKRMQFIWPKNENKTWKQVLAEYSIKKGYQKRQGSYDIIDNMNDIARIDTLGIAS